MICSVVVVEVEVGGGGTLGPVMHTLCEPHKTDLIDFAAYIYIHTHISL